MPSGVKLGNRVLKALLDPGCGRPSRRRPSFARITADLFLILGDAAAAVDMHKAASVRPAHCGSTPPAIA